jgi:hypothetical protein
MELLPRDLEKLKDIWAAPETKQSAQVVLFKALEDIDVEMAVVQKFFANLDYLLTEQAEDAKRKGDPAL